MPAEASPSRTSPGTDRLAVDQSTAFDDADTESGHVEIVAGVQVRHDRRLAAQQCRVGLQTTVADARNQVGDQRRVVGTHRDVVEKEQGFGTQAQAVVDAHRHQVDADSVEPSGHRRHLDLGAHAVGSRHQHRVAISPSQQAAAGVQPEQPREAAGQVHHPRSMSPPQQRRKTLHRIPIQVEIDAGILVGERGHGAIQP
ncbi:MAG: hypothetical protein CM1200mP2_07400 [Planctomycetaceae bacterium]|nr:MAG: hypothetical protein CM1200mP2_07400 [Planctomycetaceae bacterium]